MKELQAVINTPLGTAVIKGNHQRLSAFELSRSPLETTTIPEELKEAAKQIDEYFAGKRKQFTLSLDPSGTPFQKKVWHALSDIPYGKTISYLSLARKLGDPKAIRAVAAANGKNPLWVIIPCHRVIGSDGSLTGYAGGLWRKQWLLEHEQPEKQQSLF